MRYECAAAGELLHIDTKGLGRIDGIGHLVTGDRTNDHDRGIGWNMLHLATDHHPCVSFAQVLLNEKAVSCLQRLLAGFDALGLPVAIQLVGQAGTEARLLAVGSAFRRAPDWHRRQPDLPWTMIGVISG